MCCLLLQISNFIGKKICRSVYVSHGKCGRSMLILGNVILPLSIYKLAYKFTLAYLLTYGMNGDGSKAIFGPNNNIKSVKQSWQNDSCIDSTACVLVTAAAALSSYIAYCLSAICVKSFGKCNHKLCPHVCLAHQMCYQCLSLCLAFFFTWIFAIFFWFLWFSFLYWCSFIKTRQERKKRCDEFLLVGNVI